MNITLGNKVTWDMDPSADSYDVRLEQLSGTLVQSTNTIANEVLASALLLDGSGNPLVTVNTAYQIKVRAVNELGPSPWATLPVTVAAPAAPTNITVI